MDLIETLEGVGELHDGQLIRPAAYRIERYQKWIDAGNGRRIPGMQHYELAVDLSTEEATGYLVSRKKLTVRVQDGREMDFYVSRVRGDHVEFTVTSGFRQ